MRSATILLSPLKVNNLLLVSIINIFSSFIFVIDSIFQSTFSIIVTSKAVLTSTHNYVFEQK